MGKPPFNSQADFVEHIKRVASAPGGATVHIVKEGDSYRIAFKVGDREATDSESIRILIIATTFIQSPNPAFKEIVFEIRRRFTRLLGWVDRQAARDAHHTT